MIRTLQEVNPIKEKRDSRIKGRTCTNSSRKCIYLKDGEILASPTVSLETLFATLLVDMHE